MTGGKLTEWDECLHDHSSSPPPVHRNALVPSSPSPSPPPYPPPPSHHSSIAYCCCAGAPCAAFICPPRFEKCFCRFFWVPDSCGAPG
jgi:hypothetical protein